MSHLTQSYKVKGTPKIEFFFPMLTQCNPRNHLEVSQREVTPPSANTAEANWLRTQVGKRGKEKKKKGKTTVCKPREKHNRLYFTRVVPFRPGRGNNPGVDDAVLFLPGRSDNAEQRCGRGKLTAGKRRWVKFRGQVDLFL